MDEAAGRLPTSESGAVENREGPSLRCAAFTSGLRRRSTQSGSAYDDAVG